MIAFAFPAWSIFLLSGVAVVLAGVRLARDGDTIAIRTGLGATWVGTILVAAATSLPELTTDIYAVSQGTTSMAVGDLFGSSMANLLILALADLATPKGRLFGGGTTHHVLVGVLGIGLTALAGVGVVAGGDPSILGVGWAPLVIALGYFGGMWLLSSWQTVDSHPSQDAVDLVERKDGGLSGAIVGFALAGLTILFAARFLAGSASELATQLGVSTGFVGVALLAVTTSLPELVVTLAGIRARSYELVVGNLLGSNCFNMVILFVLDVVNGPESLLRHVGPADLVAALMAVVLTTEVIVGLLNHANRQVSRAYLRFGSIGLILTYGFGLFLSYQVAH